jgi:hypothetical protein
MIMMGSLMLRRELILPVPRPRLFPQRGGTMKGSLSNVARNCALCNVPADAVLSNISREHD